MRGGYKGLVVFVFVLIVIIVLPTLIFKGYLFIDHVVMDSDRMLPLYDKGEAIFFSQKNNYSIGEVIVFNEAGTNNLWVSRIVGINSDDTFVMKGDNARVPVKYVEESVSINQIKGVVGFSMKNVSFQFLVFSIVFLLSIVVSFIFLSYKKH